MKVQVSPLDTSGPSALLLTLNRLQSSHLCTAPISGLTATKVWGQGTVGNEFTSNNGPNPPSSFSTSVPSNAILDPQGGLYVSDTLNNRMLYYPSGAFVASRVWGPADFITIGPITPSATSMAGTSSLSLDVDGTSIFASAGVSRILYFPSGNLSASTIWGQDTAGSGFTTSLGGTSNFLMGTINSVIKTSDGLYVADKDSNRILFFPTGSFVATKVWGAPDFITTGSGLPTATTFSPSFGMAVDKMGGLYVADIGNNRVLFFPAGSTTATKVWGVDASGTNLTSPGAGTVTSTTLFAPAGLAVDDAGGLYVADSSNSRVVYFPAGSFTASMVWGQPDFVSSAFGVSSTNMHFPRAVTLDSSCRLTVTDSANNRVLYF